MNQAKQQLTAYLLLAIVLTSQMATAQNVRSPNTDTAQSKSAPAKPQQKKANSAPPRPTPAVTSANSLKGLLVKTLKEIGVRAYFDSGVADTPVNDDLSYFTGSQRVDYLLKQHGLAYELLTTAEETPAKILIFPDDEAGRHRCERISVSEFKLQFMSADLGAALIPLILPKLPNRGVQFVKGESNIYVVGSALDHLRVTQLVREIDSQPLQVTVKAIFSRRSREDVRDFGFKLASLANAATSGAALVPEIVQPGKILSASGLFVSNDADTLAANSEAVVELRTEDRKQASFSFGREVPVRTSSGFGGGFGGGDSLANAASLFGKAIKIGGLAFGLGSSSSPNVDLIEYKDASLTISVTPQVLPNGEVRLGVQLEARDVVSPKNNKPSPIEKASFTTSVILKQNEAMTVLNFHDNKANKGRAPFLALPIFSLVPKEANKRNIKNDLVLSLQPVVLGDRLAHAKARLPALLSVEALARVQPIEP